MSEKLNICLLWATSVALIADLMAVIYMMAVFQW